MSGEGSAPPLAFLLASNTYPPVENGSTPPGPHNPMLGGPRRNFKTYQHWFLGDGGFAHFHFPRAWQFGVLRNTVSLVFAMGRMCPGWLGGVSVAHVVKEILVFLVATDIRNHPNGGEGFEYRTQAAGAGLSIPSRAQSPHVSLQMGLCLLKHVTWSAPNTVYTTPCRCL